MTLEILPGMTSVSPVLVVFLFSHSEILGDWNLRVPRDPVPLVQVAGRQVCWGGSQDDRPEDVVGPVPDQPTHPGHILHPDEHHGVERRHFQRVQVSFFLFSSPLLLI